MDLVSFLHKTVHIPVPVVGRFHHNPRNILSEGLEHRKDLVEVIGELFLVKGHVCLVDDADVIIV